MKKILLLLSLVLLAYTSYGQTIIEGFNMARPDSGSFATSLEGALSSLKLTQITADKKEGASALQVTAKIGAYHEWGSYNQVGYLNKDSSTQDWSSSDTISIWIKVTRAPKYPENMVFRIQVSDKPTKADPQEQYIYENAVVLDSLHEWYLLKVPFIERNQPGTDIPDGTGFILAPTSWGGFSYNNRKLDRNKIYDWTLGIITSGYTAGVNLPADSIIVLYDGFQRSGNRAVPVTIFNGLDYTLPVTNTWSWGNASIATIKGAGTTAKTNAIQWTIADAWSGMGYDLAPTNMVGAWAKDSIQFKMKTNVVIDSLRLQFESASGKRAIKFTPNPDNAWHTYKFALKSLWFDDGAPNFDASAVNKFGFMTNGNKATSGSVIMITDMWTGNPEFDVIPPDAPTSLKATPGGFTNLLTWLDTPNEPGSKYNVYFSEKSFTDPDADPSVELLAPFALPLGTQYADHVLRSPVTDQNITYYYGLTATDAAGNISKLTPLVGPITNKAKGVPTIAKTAPTSFKADGTLTEWTTGANAVAPIVLNSFRSPATAHIAQNGALNDSSDLRVNAYLAMDAQNLYVAFDVVDDTVSVDTTATNSYEQDSPDLFIGLYDWRGKSHAGYAHGKTPDYHFRFSQNRIFLDNGAKVIMYTGANYAWKKKTLTPGYTVEAMIPFALLKSIVPADSLFTPKEGMRIPIDFAINDRDSKTTRDCILCYSSLANDNSWEFMWRWTYTWIGSQWVTAVKENSTMPSTFALEQNYPNPFNTSTKINYSLATTGNVSLKVFDVLGREVMTLVNEVQVAGQHTAVVNASRLASGMYIYKLEAGSFSSVKKMMFLK
jgi:hypothetical protein